MGHGIDPTLSNVLNVSDPWPRLCATASTATGHTPRRETLTGWATSFVGLRGPAKSRREVLGNARKERQGGINASTSSPLRIVTVIYTSFGSLRTCLGASFVRGYVFLLRMLFYECFTYLALIHEVPFVPHFRSADSLCFDRLP